MQRQAVTRFHPAVRVHHRPTSAQAQWPRFLAFDPDVRIIGKAAPIFIPVVPLAGTTLEQGCGRFGADALSPGCVLLHGQVL